MIPFDSHPSKTITFKNKSISSFLNTSISNVDWKTVQSFGEEWEKFSAFTDDEILKIGNTYFDIVDESIINKNSLVLDVGCGSGRWSKYLAKKVKFIEAIDPSSAVFQASELLSSESNTRVTQASANNIPFQNETFDFVFSLGVLHHIPDTKEAMINCVKKVKKGGYFMVYLYYSLDNRSLLFKILFYTSNLFRLIISRLPGILKKITCDFLAIFIYLPFVYLAKFTDNFTLLKKFTSNIPLSYYRNTSFKIIRNDALDRFGTPLEQRFTKNEIEEMMIASGLTEIKFSNNEPYWHAIGLKK